MKQKLSPNLIEKINFMSNAKFKSQQGIPTNYSPTSANPAVSGGNIVQENIRGIGSVGLDISAYARPMFMRYTGF